MVAVGAPALEAHFKWGDWSTCRSGQACYRSLTPPRAIIGTSAGVFAGEEGIYPEGGYGSYCVTFLFLDTTGWHYVNAGCTQEMAYLPGDPGYVYIASGCANVRSAPSLSSQVIGCLSNGTLVHVDSAPAYADGHIWWHLSGRGWMAHDFLVSPIATG